METKRLGKTDLEVGRLGIGLSEVGFNLEMTDADQVRDVINQALDNGVNFLDTAACYDISENCLESQRPTDGASSFSQQKPAIPRPEMRVKTGRMN